MKKELFMASVICLLMLFYSAGVLATTTSSTTKYETQALTTPQENEIRLDTISPSVTTVVIYNAAELSEFRDRVNNGETTLNADIEADIDLQNQNWIPIGTPENPFSGAIWANGIIEGLNVSSSSTGLSGLFGQTDGAYIYHVEVYGNISDGSISGGIVANAINTYIDECCNFCDVTGSSYAGGIVGCITATADSVVDTPTGYVDSNISGCFNAGTITGYANNSSVGGIFGFSKGSLYMQLCYNWGTICNPNGPGGGIAGTLGENGTIRSSYNMGLPDNVDPYGEIVGLATDDGSIINSYYLKRGYNPIGLNQSSYNHEIYSFDSYHDMTTKDFVTSLDGTGYFVYDSYFINNGLPVLYWEKPYTFFYDVYLDDWYIAPVNWAVTEGVTYGISDSLFGPEEVCTRAQMATFLWRAAGSPEPKSGVNPFNDVVAGSYYYKAVLWAVENGITAGTSATTFSPDDTVTRAQVVTFLWRTNGSPSMSATNPFTDTANAYYNNAVLWAVGNGITYGTSTTTFSPDSGCTRAQIVSFLYRYFVL